MELRVKPDRFTEDQQRELLRVRPEQVKTQERCVKKTMKGQLRAESEWRRAVRSEMRRRAGKQLKAWMIITREIL